MKVIVKMYVKLHYQLLLKSDVIYMKLNVNLGIDSFAYDMIIEIKKTAF